MTPSRSKGSRRLQAFALLLVSLFIFGNADAENYFRVSPGPLNAGHAAYDNSDGCVKCHASSEGVTNGKCLACHDEVKSGLHTTFGGKACIHCHTEHKGRSYGIIDWGAVGGRKTFNHEKTGFALGEYHAKVACIKCHVGRLRTGRTSFPGLSSDCQSCHKNAHGFSRAELSGNCERCHKPGQSLKGQRLSSWNGPHKQFSGLTLEGKHSEQACIKCHQGGQMSGRQSPRQCYSCHTPPHPITEVTSNCTSCHSQSSSMKSASINHSQFGFVLSGRHAKSRCASCHRRGKKGAPVKLTKRSRTRGCVDCHVATHPVVRATANCTQCHASGGRWRGAKIDHAKFGLGLAGKHKKLRCKSCHNKRQGKLNYEQGACASCHTHKNIHDNQFADKPCARCHVEGGTRQTNFSHDVDSRFPLLGFHGQDKIRGECALCHPDNIYRVGTIACADCHEDFHKGQFGKDCSKCHSPMVHFSSPRTHNFDHSMFPLEGKHKTVPCKACHQDNQYALKKHACIDCHAADDAHQGKLGKDCGRCHRPEKGAPKFSHNTMTKFPLRGGHRTSRCTLCHQPSSEKKAALTVAEWKNAKTPKLDRTFPVRGRKCSECHSDPHRGYVGNDCNICHTTTHFSVLIGPRARAIEPMSHRGSWLRRHTTLPMSGTDLAGEKLNCSTCHGTPSCRNCHSTHKPRSHTGLWRMKTHGAASEFDPSGCRVCHQTASCTQCHRRTAPLNHRGNWGSTHGYASGGFGASNCYVCHKRADCMQCHRTP